MMNLVLAFDHFVHGSSLDYWSPSMCFSPGASEPHLLHSSMNKSQLSQYLLPESGLSSGGLRRYRVNHHIPRHVHAEMV